MNKFKKLMLLVLLLVLVLTAFTVTVLAADAPYTFTKNQAKSNLNFEGWTLNETFKTKLNNDGVTTTFIAIREDYPGGNKYMYIDGMGSQGGGAAWYSEITYDRINYHVGVMPIVALDFDVMTTNGRFGTTHDSTNFVLRPYYHYSGGYKQFGSSTTGAAAAVSLGQIKLNNQAYLWQHVTIIYEWVTGGTINTYVHINGSEEPTYTATKNVSASYAGVADDIDRTFFGVPYITAAAWGQKSQLRLDNYKQTYFPVGYDLANVPTYIYNDSYTMPESYKYTVATVTDTEGTVKYFDDVNKAIAALQDGYTLSIEAEDPADTLIINNAVTIITNGYNVDFDSTEGYGVTDSTDGVLTVEKLPSATVTWDACPTPDSCSCLGAHKLAGESEVVLGETPEYLFDIPELEFNGTVLTLLGWSYDNDGEVDTLQAIDADDVANGVTLYPVFSRAEYDFKLESKGVITYYTADQYKEVFDAAEVIDNVERTVTLLRDATVYDMINLNKNYSSSQKYVNIVFDLRGNTLTRIDLTGNKYKYDAESEDYVSDGTLASTGETLFYSKQTRTNLTILSSTEDKGTVLTYKVTGDIYYDENGKLESYKATSVTGSRFVRFYNAADRKVTFRNLNIYAQNIFDGTGGTNTGVLTVDNCNYYATYGEDNLANQSMVRTFYLESSSSFEASITNSLFYYPAGIKSGNDSYAAHFMRLADNNKKSKYTVTIDNCDIIGITKVSVFGFYSGSPKISQPAVNVNNTRLYNITGNEYYTTYLGKDTVFTSELTEANSTVSSGYVSVPFANSGTYNLPVNTVVTVDADNQPAFSLEFAEQTVAFEYKVQKSGETAGSIADAKLSMIYTTNFKLVLYVPVMDGREITSVAGFTAAGTVSINGVKHNAFTKDLTTVSAGNDIITGIAYKLNNENFRQSYTVSALVYANIVLADESAVVEEKAAVGNMVRYIKEANLYVNAEADTAAFDALIGAEGLYPMGEYGTYEADTNIDDLQDYISAVSFIIENGVASYKFTLKDGADVSAFEVYLGDKKLELAVADGYATVSCENARVYDIIETLTIKADGMEDVTYSIKANIAATDSDLVKAIYEFGVAAKAYRAILEAQNEAEA